MSIVARSRVREVVKSVTKAEAEVLECRSMLLEAQQNSLRGGDDAHVDAIVRRAGDHLHSGAAHLERASTASHNGPSSVEIDALRKRITHIRSDLVGPLDVATGEALTRAAAEVVDLSDSFGTVLFQHGALGRSAPKLRIDPTSRRFHGNEFAEQLNRLERSISASESVPGDIARSAFEGFLAAHAAARSSTFLGLPVEGRAALLRAGDLLMATSRMDPIDARIAFQESAEELGTARRSATAAGIKRPIMLPVAVNGHQLSLAGTAKAWSATAALAGAGYLQNSDGSIPFVSGI